MGNVSIGPKLCFASPAPLGGYLYQARSTKRSFRDRRSQAELENDENKILVDIQWAVFENTVNPLMRRWMV
jgi:hypothetical protein